MSRNLKDKSEWSANERVFDIMGKLKGYSFTFEPETIDLIPSAEGTLGRIKPTFYTPDFYIEINSRKIMIETKGFMRGRDSIITKLADIHYTKKGYEYYVIQQNGMGKHTNKNFYLYKTKGIAHRGQKTKTIWEILGIDTPKDNQIFQKAKMYAKFETLIWKSQFKNTAIALDKKIVHYTYYNNNSTTNKKTKKYQELTRKHKNNVITYNLMKEFSKWYKNQ